MTVAELFKNSKGNKLLAHLFSDVGEESGGGGGKKGKSGSANTISSSHREQLDKLMKTLDATSPHFVRCIIPNELKTGGVLDAHLVMQQLHCNGVLEGIRICRKGYPSRLLYKEFLARYGILAASRVKAAKDLKSACFEVLDEIKLDVELYRIGLTKVLFKAGILGILEEHRDIIIEKLLKLLQAQMRRYLVKKNIKKMLEQKKAVTMIQKNVKAALALKTWKWMSLWSNMKPLLQGQKREEERKAREAEEARLAELERIEKERQAAEAAERAKELAANAAKLAEDKVRMVKELGELNESLSKTQGQVSVLAKEKADLESFVSELEEKVHSTEAFANGLSAKKKQLELELSEQGQNMEQTGNRLKKAESDCRSKEATVKKLQDEMAVLDDTIARLTREKKRFVKIFESSYLSRL